MNLGQCLFKPIKSDQVEIEVQNAKLRGPDKSQLRKDESNCIQHHNL